MSPIFQSNSLSLCLPRTNAVVRLPNWGRYLLILLVATLAHCFALQATFYGEDAQMLESAVFGEGSWAAQECGWLLAGIWQLTGHLFGGSGVAFHALNLGTHFLLCCLVYVVGKELLGEVRRQTPDRSREHAALLGALIFACHPLGTEAVHQASGLVYGLSAVAGMVSLWCLLRWRDYGAPVWGLALLVTLAGAKGISDNAVSLVLATMVLFGLLQVPWRSVRQWSGVSLSGRQRCIALICLGALGILLVPWLDSLFAEHILTQGRVFWEYLHRIFIPLNLSADHHLAWSTGPSDRQALFALLGIGLILGLSFWALSRPRWRLVGLLILLGVAPLLYGFAEFSPEVMVEKRVYASLPWFALLMGCSLVWLRDHQRSMGVVLALGLLIWFSSTSYQRSTLWKSEGALIADVLKQYPSNLDALTQMQANALRNGNYALAIQMMTTADDQLRQHQRALERPEVRQWDSGAVYNAYTTAHLQTIKAIAELGGPSEAQQYADSAAAFLVKTIPGFDLPAFAEAARASLPSTAPAGEEVAMR